MPWNSPLTRWQNEHPVQLASESPVVEPAEQPTEKRNYTLQSYEAQRLLAFGAPNLSGVAVNNDSSLSLPPIYAAFNIISDGIAMLDRQVKGKSKNGFDLLDDHPIQLFLNGKPHPFYTWFDLTKALLINALFGNGYLRIWWDEFSARPYALELIPTGMVWPELIDGQLWYYIGGELNGRIVSERVPHTDIIHIKGLTTNGINGRQISLVHQPTIGAGLAAKQYTGSVFGKQAKPSIAIKQKDAVLDHGEAAIIEQNIMARMSGSENAGRPFVLDNGQDVVYLQWTPQDVAYIDFTRLNAEEVAAITKVPMEMIVAQQYGTRASASQHNQNLLTHCYGPWIERIQEEFNCKIFWNSEFRTKSAFFEYDTSMYVSLDKETEAKVLVSLVAGSILTPNEARGRMNLPPVEGADELFADINSLPLKDLVKVATAKYLSSEGEKLQGEQANDNSKQPDDAKPEPESKS